MQSAINQLVRLASLYHTILQHYVMLYKVFDKSIAVIYSRV